MDISSINSDLIRGNVTTIILRSLLEEDRYGYDILKEIEVKSEGHYKLKQPTLYGCLKRLEKNGLISSYLGDENNTEGGRRRYYKLTEEGRGYLLKMQSEYEYSRTILNKLLSEDDYDFSNPAPFDVAGLRPYTKRRADFEEETPSNAPPIVQAVKKAAEQLKEPSYDLIADDLDEIADTAPLLAELSFKDAPVHQEAPEARTVARSLSDVLDTMNQKLENKEEQAASPEEPEDKSTSGIDKFSFTNFVLPKKSAGSRPQAEVEEEQRLKREEAAKMLKIGKHQDVSVYNFERFGIKTPQKHNSDEQVPAAKDGEDPA